MRKAILLMAVTIVAAFAVSGSASANWIKHHQALPTGQNVELEITGTDLFFETEVGGVTCTKTLSKILLEGGTTTGKFLTFAPELDKLGDTITSVCHAKGLIAQCEVHEATVDGLPWTIHTVSSGTVSITNGTFTNTLTGFFCPHTLQLTPGTITMTVAAGEVNTTAKATLSGNLSTDGDLGSGIATTFSGQIDILGTITYGF